ncbi:MAG TPA: hypothetical protein VMF31_10420 [Solirubrobacterales bacterium]|nr:hypothetical protein [Solirubrobacterales bacterium]
MTAEARASAGGQIESNGYLKAGGKKVLVGGTTPDCRKGAAYVLDFRLRQGGQVAKGRWKSEKCVGGPAGWTAALPATEGGRFDAGRARVDVTAKLRKSGRTVSTRRFGRNVRLFSGARPVGDREIYGGVTFVLGEGADVKIVGGGAFPKSNCTRDETTTSFQTTEYSQRKVFQFVAKDGGSCWTEASWSNFKVTVSRPGISHTGTMYLGQSPGGPYYVSCYSGNSFEVSEKYRYDWTGSGLRCAKTDDYELKITVGS